MTPKTGAAPGFAAYLPDASATARAGAALGRALRGGDCVFLSGPLGAGKSALARAAIQARLADLGRYEDAPSPTFTLVQPYDAGAVEIRHADLYRLSSPEEAEELGLVDETEQAILLIEWGERLRELAPPRRLEIELAFPPDLEGRLLTASAVAAGALDQSWDPVFTALAEAVGSGE
ncbi:MAG: tRNA (adenosine(37)-N6)-threonylcarbamoyltransferase complex ATPase subunit type 1 TsaE [Neomegalonema sp.]|nr:tRNA (adenosine(37)-N6)-threonylcarbamoyltransferase complex ATPase subunit type 1 TsaE [Neomegalonema sp.]